MAALLEPFIRRNDKELIKQNVYSTHTSMYVIQLFN